MYSHFAYHIFTLTYLGPKVNVLHFICFHVAVSLQEITLLEDYVDRVEYYNMPLSMLFPVKFKFNSFIYGYNESHGTGRGEQYCNQLIREVCQNSK